MRYVTTLVLFALAAGGAGLWYAQCQTAKTVEAPSVVGTIQDLKSITPDSLLGIEFGDVKLERAGRGWQLPGNWPTRASEVDEFVHLLSNLSTRFAPLRFTDEKDFGFAPDQRPVVVKATVALEPRGEKIVTLTFGEADDSGNSFTRPTYVRLDDRSDVLRLAPGLVPRLRKTREDFLRRQLFPEVVRAKLSDPGRGMDELPAPAVPLLEAKEIAVTSPDGTWSLKRLGETSPTRSPTPIAIEPEKLAAQWELASPTADRVDPEKLVGILGAIPQLWVEQFVTEADPQKTGLDNPERTLNAKTADGELKVLIGKVSRVETKPAPPLPPGMPPQPPTKEEYRYAKLPNNPQVFEVRTDRFADLFVRSADLRDAKLARFKPADVQKLELQWPDRKLAFAREGDSWKLLEPVAATAETVKVTELLDKLAALQARGGDVIDSADRKPFGLADGDRITNIGVTLKNTGESSPIQFRIGKDDLAKSKLYVQIAGNNRVNAVSDDVMKFIDRPALAYRSRRVIDVSTKQLAQIIVDRPSDAYALTNTDEKWMLSQPVQASADPAKSAALANDLARLEAVEFVNFTPTPEELKTYGLDAPTSKVALKFSDAAMPAKTLLIGKPREGRAELYAKLAEAPEVFAIRPTIKEAIDQPSLAYRPLQLWQAAGPLVQSIEVIRGSETFKVQRDGASWKVSGPFDAPAFLPAVQPLMEAAAAPRAERYAAHSNDDLKNYGLDSPSETLRVSIQEKADSPATVKELLVGKPVVEGQSARFARLPDQAGIFVLPAGLAKALEKPALDLLDRRLIAVDVHQIAKIEGTGPNGTWSATKAADKWTIDSIKPAEKGDRVVIDSLVQQFADLRAEKFAAYAPTDWAAFGLDKPQNTVTISWPAGDKSVLHTIALGKSSEGARFARIDDGPAVAVLSTAMAAELNRSALDLVDRGIFDLDAKNVTAMRRSGGGQELVLERKDGAWQMVKPQAVAADDPFVSELVHRLSNLRAVKVVSIAASDPKAFGLDTPAATLTLVMIEKDGRSVEKILRIGRQAPDGRYAQIDSDIVYTIPDSKTDPLATRLLAEPIAFRDRILARFTDANRITVNRGERVATFAKLEGTWRMTAPVNADAESFALDDLVLAASKLRADELLAEKPADPKPFGLDKPEAELHFFQGDKEVLTLAVSAKATDGRATVKSAQTELVGNLDATLSNRFLAEFRKRALWTNLDVVQTDTVIINSGIGAPLMLTKAAGGWHIADKPSELVKPEAVSELLATFAGLKAERFVADQKPDLKLFGLDPPARVIVVKQANGQTTTLNLGRYEGDSRRVYAAIPNGDSVVVLSEADSGKVMKPIADIVSR